MNMDVLTFNLDTTCLIWKAIEDHLLPTMKKKEIFLIDQLIRLKKGNTLIDEYIKTFNFIFDHLTAIRKPIIDPDQYFHLSWGLWPKYQDIRLHMLYNAPYPTYTQFVLALKSHDEVLQNFWTEENQWEYQN